MLETLLGFALWGSFVWWVVITSILLILFILSEASENGFFATGSLIVYLGFMYFWGNFDFSTLFTWAVLFQVLMYIGVGLVYAMIRTIVQGKQLDIEIKKVISNQSHWVKTKQEAIKYRKDSKKDHIEDLKLNVARWIFLWPVSLFYWIFASRIFIELWDLLWGKISKFFEGIFTIGFGKDDDLGEFKEKPTKS